jgi:glyceraldehyde 3-phosphate dehydrogenase
MELDYLEYLLKYDSVHGRFPGTIEKADGGIKVNG